jgi:DNA repair exonuclease SbcCD ATPase subunit
VSLAFTLTLPYLVIHKPRIDSLFLDEGGILNSEALDIAPDTLDNLNACGKMIEVISHVCSDL